VPDVTSTTLYFGLWYRKPPLRGDAAVGLPGLRRVQPHVPARLHDELVAEYWALVNDVTLWDVGVERVVQISGPDGFALTNLITCRDLTRCAAGQGKYTAIPAMRGSNPIQPSG
jgi:glycine cleavage system aminomethyltransferase T